MNKSLPPPVTTVIHMSTSTCSLSGDPPFTVSYTHENTGTEPIWTLASRFSNFCNGFAAREYPDGERRRGLVSLINSSEWDDDALDLEDTELVKLDPGQAMCRSYTLSAVEKRPPYILSDMHKFEVGHQYKLWLDLQRWRWMFAREVPEEILDDQKLAGK